MDQLTTSDSIIIEENILSDDEDKIRVYGSTRLTSPSGPKSRRDDPSQVRLISGGVSSDNEKCSVSRC